MIERLGKIVDNENSIDVDSKRLTITDLEDDDDNDSAADYKINEKYLTSRGIQTTFINNHKSPTASYQSSIVSSRSNSIKNNTKK